MSLKNKLAAAFAVALVLLGIVAWFDWRHMVGMQETAKWVTHTEKVRFELMELLSDLQDIESGEIGFVTTGNPSYLEPFNASLGKVNSQLQSLRQLTRDNPSQQSNCDTLKPLIAQRIAAAQGLVNLRRNTGFGAARMELSKGTGEAVMEQIRVVVARMDAEEQ